MKRTVYVYDADTWENPVIFGKMSSESVSRAIDAKIVVNRSSSSRVSIESYPDILRLLDKFRKKVSSKKGIYSTRLILGGDSIEKILA